MLRIALGQMDVIPGRPDMNSHTMLSMIQEARAASADIIVFPEMAIPGYLLGDTWEQQAFLRDCEEYGNRIIAASEGICVIFGNVGVDWKNFGDDGRVRKYNAFFIAQNGRLCSDDHFPYPFRIKTLLPNYREFDDTRHFYSLRKLAVDLGRSVRDLLRPARVEIGNKKLRIGSLICEDGWYDDYPVNPVAEIAANGPIDLLINISSSPFTLGKQDKRHRVFGKQARETGAPLVYLNNVGMQNNGKTVYTFDGASTIYDRQGQVVVQCPSFKQALEIYKLDLKGTQNNTNSTISIEDKGIETVYQALSYGTAKFLKQIGMERVVIGASGGIDSAVSAALYVNILGPENVLLTNLPSVYNSATTRGLAEDLAKRLGCLYAVVPIQESVDHTIRQLSTTAVLDLNTGGQRHLTITPFIAENIQARDRSARVLAGLAAAFGGGFTCNANKSELTVGYSTLYGDQAGFLAVLADLWKHQVYALGRYLNEQVFRAEVIPEGVFTLVPSAELSAEQNVDEGKGDPIVYPYHDYLFRSFMEWWNRATPEDLLGWYASGELETKLGCEPGLVSKLFPGPKEFIADLEKWWKLYSGMGVAKRIQAPPVLAVSRRAYGFDHREAQNSPYFTAKYRELKERLLSAAQ